MCVTGRGYLLWKQCSYQVIVNCMRHCDRGEFIEITLMFLVFH